MPLQFQFVPRPIVQAFKLVSPAEKIPTSNRFSVLMGASLDSTPKADPSSLLAVPSVPTLRPAFTPTKPQTVKTAEPGNTNEVHTTHTQVNQLTTPSRSLIKLAGTVAGHAAVFLVDSGATGNFVSSSFVTRTGLHRSVHPSTDTVSLADGVPKPAGGFLPSTPIHLSTYRDRLDLTLTELSGYDVILGMPWLDKHNPDIDWRGKIISFVTDDHRQHVLRKVPTGAAVWRDPRLQPMESNSLRLNLISAKQLKAADEQGQLDYACIVYPELMRAAPDPVSRCTVHPPMALQSGPEPKAAASVRSACSVSNTCHTHANATFPSHSHRNCVVSLDSSPPHFVR